MPSGRLLDVPWFSRTPDMTPYTPFQSIQPIRGTKDTSATQPQSLHLFVIRVRAKTTLYPNQGPWAISHGRNTEHHVTSFEAAPVRANGRIDTYALQVSKRHNEATDAAYICVQALWDCMVTHCLYQVHTPFGCVAELEGQTSAICGRK